jgi:hypothetical protein
MSMLLMLKEGGSLGIDTIGNKPIDEDINITDVLKFILASGSADNITVANNALSFTEYDGTTDNISTMGGILSFTKYDGTVDNINLIN